MNICAIGEPKTVSEIFSQLCITCGCCYCFIVRLLDSKLQGVVIICYYKKMLLVKGKEPAFCYFAGQGNIGFIFIAFLSLPPIQP